MKKKRHLKFSAGERPANHILCTRIAERLEGLGFKPFRSEAERYLVTIPADDATPEILEIGRSWKGGRIFRNNIVGRDTELIKQFGQFAEADKLGDCYFWNLSLTGCKAAMATLVADVERFNSDINQHFTELRKKHRFELLVLALHFRYDEHQNAIDLHAHFVCRVPSNELAAAQLYLRTKFSLPHLDVEPIENAEAVLNYMLSGIFDNFEMIDWPDEALAAVWEMTQCKRYRYVRTGGSFARWRKEGRNANDNVPCVATPQKPAFVTAPGQDRFLAKVTAKVRGKRIAALLYERPVDEQLCPTSNVVVYSTASRGTTQELRKARTTARKNELEPPIRKHPLLDGVRAAFRYLGSKVIAKMTQLKNAFMSRRRN